MHIRPSLFIAIACLMVGLSVSPDRVAAEEPTATGTATSIPVRFFNVRLNAKKLDAPAGPLQDVQGKVVSQTGGGVDGVLVRAFSTDWQAFEMTQDQGKFRFSLTQGSYTIQLVDVVGQELKLTADGKSELQVEFYEVDSLAISATQATPTPTVTATATESPTATTTPFPTSTLPSLPADIASLPAATPTPDSIVSSLAFPAEIDLEPWLKVFLYGAAAGGGLMFLSLVVSLVRRL